MGKTGMAVRKRGGYTRPESPSRLLFLAYLFFFLFLAFVLGDFFFGHLVVRAGGEHVGRAAPGVGAHSFALAAQSVAGTGRAAKLFYPANRV